MNLHHLKALKLSPIAAIVDIESCDTIPSTIINSIGCVLRNVFTGETIATFYVRCKITPQRSFRTESASTLEFWKGVREESPEAYAEAFSNELERHYLKDALEMFNAFLEEHVSGKVQLFGNGCDFDNAALLDAMTFLNIKPAWHYGGNQHLRTAVWMGRMLLGDDPKYNLPAPKIKHHALYDAIHEADYLTAIFKSFINVVEKANRYDDMLAPM
jgi:hypothetical protein